MALGLWALSSVLEWKRRGQRCCWRRRDDGGPDPDSAVAARSRTKAVYCFLQDLTFAKTGKRKSISCMSFEVQTSDPNRVRKVDGEEKERRC